MSRNKRFGRALAVAISGLSLAVAAVTVALAGQGLKTKSKTVQVGPDDVGSATAKCKRGTKAVSGGFEGEPFDPDVDTPFFAPNQSSRTGGREWTTEAYNYSGVPEGDLTSFAYCRDEKVKRRTATVSVDPDEISTVTAKCKPGTKAISGGFEADETDLAGPNPFFLLGTSRKEGKGAWEVAALNTGDEVGDLSAQVNCREGKGLKTKQASEEVGNPPERELVELKVRCKRNQRVVSGGFAGGLDFPGTESVEPFTSMKVGKRAWRVVGFAKGEVTAYAYCEKKK